MDPHALVKLLQKHAPPGMKYVLSLAPVEHEALFEEVIGSRGTPSRKLPTPLKRYQLSMHGAVLTKSDFKEQLVEKKKQELVELGKQQLKLKGRS